MKHSASFLDKFALGCRDAQIVRDKPLIVGISGGADSTALLKALVSLGFDCRAAHVNFALRGVESDRDESCARKLTDSLGVPFSSLRVDAKAYAAKNGLSLEMACREIRYDWFDELSAKFNAQGVAVAHTLDDQVETLLLNLSQRPTGLAGLRGMRPRVGLVLRPMLGLRRSEVEEFLRTTSTHYVTDSSNLTDEFRRNRVRHHVIPALESVAPAAIVNIATTMGYIAETEDLLRRLVAERCAPFVGSDNTIDLHGLSNACPTLPLAPLLFQFLKEKGFDRTTVDNILASFLADRSGAVFTDNSDQPWLLDRGTLRPYISSDAPCIESHNLYDIPVKVTSLTDTQRPEVDGRRAIILDRKALDGNPLWQWRPWHRGDRIEPFGMAGRSKLVSDILSDAKIPLDAKNNVRVLARDGQILWVAGLRASRHFPVTDGSVSLLLIEILGD